MLCETYMGARGVYGRGVSKTYPFFRIFYNPKLGPQPLAILTSMWDILVVMDCTGVAKQFGTKLYVLL